MINPRGTGWARQVTHVREEIYTRNILVEQPERMIILGRPRYRWENNVKRDLKDIEWKSVYWILLVLFKEMGGGAVLNFRRLMSYIYGAPILDVSRSHTTTQHSR